jgi:hypothetical protein
VETACQVVLSALDLGPGELEQLPDGATETPSIPPTNGNGSATQSMTVATTADPQNAQAMVTPLPKQVRRRNKAHLAFVAAQPCLVCQRSPCDAHHLKFAEPRTLGRKVSDEFTVPLCRDHHHELHRHGNEMAWWANLQIAPIEVAKELWTATLLQTAAVAGSDTAAAEKQSRQEANLDLNTDAEIFGSASPCSQKW